MSSKPFIEMISTTIGRGPTSNKCGINNILPKEFTPIIKALIIKITPQQFNGGLCPILFDFRQINIIDKNNNIFIGSCTKDSLGFFIQF
jgi:hypothetical protein